MQQKIVFTGAPGTGKTTIINELTNKGYRCLPEISREIIHEAKNSGVDNIFNTSPIDFSKKLLSKRIAQYESATKLKCNIILFDRGIPDILAYLKNCSLEDKIIFSKAAKNYKYTTIYLFAPWKEIYTTDNERLEDFEESVKIHQNLIKTYTDLGYNIIEVPKSTIADRVSFIIKNIDKWNL